MSSFLADFFGDSTDSLTRVDEDFTPNNSESFLHTSSKVLGQVLCSTLQNAVNSTSYIKHQRSLKSSLPFLYNQTIRKIDSRGSVYDVEASLMVSYNLFLISRFMIIANIYPFIKMCTSEMFVDCVFT